MSTTELPNTHKRQNSEMPKIETKGFGASKDLGAHLFIIKIPAGRGGVVEVIEYFGFAEGFAERPNLASEELRALRISVPRDLWSKVSDDLRFEFNQRLKQRDLATSKWIAGENFVDKLLGKEMMVLLWAISDIEAKGEERDQLISTILQRWMALRPEERWWLYFMAANEVNLDSSVSKGWRAALYFALSGSESKSQINPPPTRSRNDGGARTKSGRTKENVGQKPHPNLNTLFVNENES